MKSLRAKLIVMCTSIILFVVALIAVPTLFARYYRTVDSVMQKNALTTELAIKGVTLFFREPIETVECVGSYISAYDGIQDETFIQKFFHSIIKDNNCTNIFVASRIPYKDGGSFITNLKWNPPADFDQTAREWFINAQKDEETHVSRPYRDLITKEFIATVSRKFMVGGKFAGVIGLSFNFDKLLTLMDNVHITPSSKSFLINSQGKYILHEDFNKIDRDDFFKDFGLNDYRNKITDAGSFVFDLEAGGGQFLAMRKVSDKSDWIFATVGPRNEILGVIWKNCGIVMILSVLSVIIGAVISYFIAGQIVRPIKAVDRSVHTIASGEADLTGRISVKNKDEIGDMISGFNKFIEKLHGIISQVKLSKESLACAGNSLSEGAADTISSVAEMLTDIDALRNQIVSQSSSVEETAGAVNEIASNITSLERMIENQSAGVTQASAAVEQMVGNINAVNSSVEKMADSFEALQEDARNGAEKQQAVNKRIEMIESQSQMLKDANAAIANIAEQTNLLAMNAAIEAAHAGDAGKGFSVVADEIRKLSETSSTQSKTIGEQLNKIKEAINEVVDASAQSSSAFNAVSVKIRDTDEQVRHIKSAMQEQAEGSRQINEALHSMNDSTAEVRIASEEMSAGNKAILEEVKRLQDATARMNDCMGEMNRKTKTIDSTSASLRDVAHVMEESIAAIGGQIDMFKV